MKLLIPVVLAIALCGCAKPEAGLPKSLILQQEELRPVAAWVPVGIVQRDGSSLVYVLNSRNGTVCEHDYFDSRIKPGEKARIINCSPPEPLYQ